MRIVRKDNFDRDEISEEFILWRFRSKTNAEAIARYLNEESGPDGPYYYKVVEDDYKLYKFVP